MIHFGEVTPENWRKVNALKVSEEQKNFVAANVTILARAYAYRDEGSKVLTIFNDEEMIGLVFYREWNNRYILDQFMIDHRYQGKGYSKKALVLILEMLKKEEKYGSVELCYCEGNIAAEKLFKNFGFSHVESEDGDHEDEIIMALNF